MGNLGERSGEGVLPHRQRVLIKFQIFSPNSVCFCNEIFCLKKLTFREAQILNVNKTKLFCCWNLISFTKFSACLTNWHALKCDYHSEAQLFFVNNESLYFCWNLYASCNTCVGGLGLQPSIRNERTPLDEVKRHGVSQVRLGIYAYVKKTGFCEKVGIWCRIQEFSDFFKAKLHSDMVKGAWVCISDVII